MRERLTSYLHGGFDGICPEIPDGDGAILTCGADYRLGGIVYFGTSEVPMIGCDLLERAGVESCGVEETEGLV